MKVVSSSRNRSGLAWASCSSISRAPSILGVTVIVVSFFESVVRDHSKDHAVAVAYITTTRSPPNPYTTLMDSTAQQSDARLTRSLSGSSQSTVWGVFDQSCPEDRSVSGPGLFVGFLQPTSVLEGLRVLTGVAGVGSESFLENLGRFRPLLARD